MADMEVNYYTPKESGSFSGVDKLYRSQKHVSRKTVRDWLKGEDAYTLHKPVRYHFRRNKVIVSGLDDQWDVDLMIMAGYEHQNDGFRYVLVAIDILSHYVWTRSLKTKSGKDVADAFSSIFKEGRKPSKIRSDQGFEFRSKIVQRLFQEQKIVHFTTSNEVKANYAERVIRTLKMKISRYFTHKQTHRWKDILKDITFSYNNTYHRTISRTPSSVNAENESDVWQHQYKTERMLEAGPFKFRVGDNVRISHLRSTFQREYDERYTGEIFKVKTQFVRNGLNLYTLQDFLDEEVVGTFYEPELQKISTDPTGVFKVEKVLRTRKRRGFEKEYLIRWMNWPPKFDSWVKSSDLQDV